MSSSEGSNFHLSAHISKQRMRVTGSTEVHFAHYALRNGVTPVSWLDVPCRSNLHRLMILLFWNGNWSPEGEIQVGEEEAKALRVIFGNQRVYSFWKQALEVYKARGKAKTLEWLIENVPVLKLKEKLEQ